MNKPSEPTGSPAHEPRRAWPMIRSIAGYGRSIFLVGLVVLIVSAWWLSDVFKRPPERVTEAGHVPQYFMQDFTLSVAGPEGRPDRWLRAEKMVYFADDDSTHLTRPQVSIRQIDGGEWQARAGSGVVVGDNQVYLSDQVVVQHPAVGDGSATEAHSEKLFVNLETAYAETDSPVTVVSGKSQVKANAMRAYIDRNTLQLYAGVRGRYEQ